MRAARITAYGTDPVVQEVPEPQAGEGQVLVRVAAAALNPLDITMTKGYMHDFFPVEFPYTVGTDVSGTVEALGQGVSGFSVGDAVVARLDPSAGGALAELVVAPADLVVAAPGSVPLPVAAGIGTTGGTAVQALFETAKLQPGQTVLVHAGAGGVGSMAIQLAKAAGARVVATASGDGIEIARRLGADEVVDHREQDFAREVKDVDVVLDTVGGETQQRSFAAVKPGGWLVSLVSAPDEALAAEAGVKVTWVFHSSDGTRLRRVVEAVDAGAEVLVDRTVPLAQLDQAWAHQASQRARGKILITP